MKVIRTFNAQSVKIPHFKEARKGIFVDVVFVNRSKITKKDI